MFISCYLAFINTDLVSYHQDFIRTTMDKTSRKRKSCTIIDKIQVINSLENGDTNKNICQRFGEENSVDKSTVETWLNEVWPSARSNYSDGNIFNVDETGLFFNLMPDKTLRFKNDNKKLL